MIIDARQMDYLYRTAIVFNNCHNYGYNSSEMSLLGYYSFCYDTQPLSSTTPVRYTYRVNIFNWSYVPSYSIDDNLTGHILHG